MILLYRLVQFQYSSVAVDSRYCGGHYYCWSVSSGHLEMYHLLEGIVTMGYHCNYGLSNIAVYIMM